ncbi:MAG: ATP-binding protein [Chitinophagales bacterium]
MTEQAPSSRLTFKILIGLALSLGTIGFAAKFAYQNFQKLLGSVTVLSHPDTSLHAMQEIVNMMHAADGSMRTYIMTNDNDALQIYMEEMDTISVEIEKMQQDPSFAGSEKALDSLNDFFTDKAFLMYSLVIFKKSSEYEQLTNKALFKINDRAISDAAPIPGEVPGQKEPPGIKQQAIADNAIDEDKKDKKSKKKDEGFLRNLFGGKNKDKDPEQATIVALTDTATFEENTDDLEINIADNPSINIEDVRRVLREIYAESRKYNTQLTVRELEILASDKLILEKINEVIEQIQSKRQNVLTAQVESARANAEKSSRTMMFIALGALFAGLVFSGVIINDINKAARYRRQLVEARKKAEYLARVKEEFLANMSHEIRTPLNAIIGFSEQLEHTALQSKQKTYVQAVSSAGTHLLNTVNDILDYSKIEAGKLAFDPHPVQLKQVIRDVAVVMEIKAREKGLEIHTETDATCDEYVLCDDFRLRQVLFNLVGNAIKFTEKGSVRMLVTGEKLDASIRYTIEVEDTGIGIEQDNLEGIFESFEQADTATTRKFGGTGLGLSIARKIVELSGGKILAKSVIDMGSVFTITLPLPLASGIEVQNNTSENKAGNDLEGLATLVVDDEPYNLMLAEVILKKYKIKVKTASNGSEALALIEKNSFDIVLADLQMPEIDGYILAEKIREKYLQVPLIALTANVMQNDLEKIRTAGFNDILLKPYKERNLISMLSKYAPLVLGNAYVENGKESESTSNGAFHLDEIRKFADNDPAIIAEVIRSFIQSNTENLATLETAVTSNDIKKVNNTAHKMLPSFTHFGVHAAVHPLKQCELYAVESDGDLQTLYAQISAVSKTVFALLEKEEKALRQDADV